MKEYVLKFWAPHKPDAFSAWYVPKHDVLLKMGFSAHSDFIEMYFSKQEPKIVDIKPVQNIINEARKELKGELGPKSTSSSYKDFYDLGWIRLNGTPFYNSVTATENFAAFIKMANYVIDFHHEDIELEYKNRYVSLKNQLEHVTEEEIIKEMRNDIRASERIRLIANRVVKSLKTAKFIKMFKTHGDDILNELHINADISDFQDGMRGIIMEDGNIYSALIVKNESYIQDYELAIHSDILYGMKTNVSKFDFTKLICVEYKQGKFYLGESYTKKEINDLLASKEARLIIKNFHKKNLDKKLVLEQV